MKTAIYSPLNIHLAAGNDPIRPRLNFIEFKNGRATATDGNFLVSVPMLDIFPEHVIEEMPETFYIQADLWATCKFNKAFTFSYHPENSTLSAYDRKGLRLGVVPIDTDISFPKWECVFPSESELIGNIGINSELLARVGKVLGEYIQLSFSGTKRAIIVTHLMDQETNGTPFALLMPCKTGESRVSAIHQLVNTKTEQAEVL